MPLDAARDPQTCIHNEYGDQDDPMGMDCGHIGVLEKQHLGWLGGCNSVRVNQSGTFTLHPVESECDGIQALQIPMPTTGLPAGGRFVNREGVPQPVQYYYLELRTQTGRHYDVPYYPRVLVRVGADYPERNQTGRRTWLLDMDPSNGFYSIVDGMVQGQTFNDPAGGVSFSVRALSNTSATVEVTVPTNAPHTCVGGGTIAAPGPSTCGNAGAGGMAGASGAGGMAGAGGAAGVSGAGGTAGMAGAGGMAGNGAIGGTTAGGIGGGAGLGGAGASSGGAGLGGAGGAGTSGGAAGRAGTGGLGIGGEGEGGAATGGSNGNGGDAGEASAGEDGTGRGGSGGDSGEAGTPSDAGRAGASTGGAGGGGTGDAGTNAGEGGHADGVDASSAEDSGCGCRIDQGSSRHDATVWLGLFSALAGIRAERRRERRRLARLGISTL